MGNIPHPNHGKYRLFLVLKIVLFVLWSVSVVEGCFLWIQIRPQVLVSSLLKSWESWAWWYVPLFSASRRQRQINLCDLKANLAYIVSSRPASQSYIVRSCSLQSPKKPQQNECWEGFLLILEFSFYPVNTGCLDVPGLPALSPQLRATVSLSGFPCLHFS